MWSTIFTLCTNVRQVSAYHGLKLDLNNNQNCPHSTGVQLKPCLSLGEALGHAGKPRLCEMEKILCLSLEIQFDLLCIVVCLFVIYLTVSSPLQDVLLACRYTFGDYQKEIAIGGQI